MRSASNLSVAVRPFAPQLGNWIDLGGDPHMSIKRVIDRMDVNTRGWLRLIVAQHPDIAIMNRWFDMLDAIEDEINAARTTIVTNRVATIIDPQEWARAYNLAYGKFLIEADRIWFMRKSLWAGEITAWLESL